MKFLSYDCSIVCRYCSVVCLIAKSELKMIKFSSSVKLNEIYIVESPFNEDPKNINYFSWDALISGEGRPENLGKWEITGRSIVYKSGGGEFQKSISAPTTWYQNHGDASIFLHARPNFRRK